MSQEENKNCLDIEDVQFEVQPTVKIYRHKSNGLLSVSITLDAESDDSESFTMSIEKMPTDIADIKELEQHNFNYDIKSSLAGFIDYDDDKHPNEDDKIEILKVTDEKIVMKWNFICSAEWVSLFEYKKLYEVVFEAKYEIEDTEEEYPVVYSEFVPAEGEINYMNVEGIRYEIEPKGTTLEFFRYKDSPLLTMDLCLHPYTYHNHVELDDEDNCFCMYIECARIGIRDVKELKGKVFHHSDLEGYAYLYEHEPNREETMEILDVTDSKILIRWSGICTIDYTNSFDSVFEATYSIQNTDYSYFENPTIFEVSEEAEEKNEKEIPDDSEIWTTAKNHIVCKNFLRKQVVLYHSDDTFLIWLVLQTGGKQVLSVMFDNEIFDTKTSSLDELNGAVFKWKTQGKHGWDDCEQYTQLKIDSITAEKIKITLRSHWINDDTDTLVEATFENTVTIYEMEKKGSNKPALRLCD